MPDINLIPSEIKEQKERVKRAKNIQLASIIIFVICLLASGGTFAYKCILENSVKSLSTEIESEKAKIISLKDVESKMFLFKDKASFLYNVLSSRPYYSVLLENVGEVLPLGLYITDMGVSVENKISIGGVTPSYAVLADLISNVVEDSKNTDSVFDYPELTSASLREETGRIEFSMNVYLKENALNIWIK